MTEEKTNLYPTMQETGETPQSWQYEQMTAQEAHQEMIQGTPKAGLTYDTMDGLDDETRALIGLADKGEFQTLAERVKSELKGLGATDKDMAMIDYFRDAAVPGHPGWQDWSKQMVLWIRGAVKGRKK